MTSLDCEVAPAFTTFRTRVGDWFAATAMAALLVLSVGACAGDPATAENKPATAAETDESVNDPIEPVNRAIFGFNEYFYEYVLGPISTAYTDYLPSPLRQAIHNFLANLQSPVILANDVLQGEAQRAMETLGRAIVNSTIGMGGIVDMGAEMGVRRHKEDFGQTMGVWGVGEGLYVVIPLLGPSNPRDAVGQLFVDSYFDPMGLWLSNIDRDDLLWARTGVKGVDEYSNVREELAQVKKTSIDYYAAIRSLYRQKRKAEISNGRDIKLPPIPDLTYEFDTDLPQPSATPPLRVPSVPQ